MCTISNRFPFYTSYKHDKRESIWVHVHLHIFDWLQLQFIYIDLLGYGFSSQISVTTHSTKQLYLNFSSAAIGKSSFVHDWTVKQQLQNHNFLRHEKGASFTHQSLLFVSLSFSCNHTHVVISSFNISDKVPRERKHHGKVGSTYQHAQQQ